MNIPFALVILIGAVGGVAVTVQAALAGVLTQEVGVLENGVIVFGGGFLTALILILLSGRLQSPTWPQLPWYVYLAGPLGIVIISSIGISIPQIGVGSTLTLIVTSQLIIAAVMDHFGILTALKTLDLNRLIGFVLLLIGTWIVLRQ